MKMITIKCWFLTHAQVWIVLVLLATNYVNLFLETILARLDREVMKCSDALSDTDIERTRVRFESTTAGRKAVASSPERKLYAVLKPTREENIRRILNVLYGTNKGKLNISTKAK